MSAGRDADDDEALAERPLPVAIVCIGALYTVDTDEDRVAPPP